MTINSDSRGDRCHCCALARVRLDDDSVLAHLLLHQDDLFRALDHKVSSRVKGTFTQLRHPIQILSRQDTSIAPEHNGYPADPDTFPSDDFPVTHIFDIHCDRSGVGRVTEAAFVRSDQLIFQSGGALIRPCRHADVNVGISKEEFRVNVRGNQVVRLEDLFEFGIDKVVE
jgi:hypothetical protein